MSRHKSAARQGTTPLRGTLSMSLTPDLAGRPRRPCDRPSAAEPPAIQIDHLWMTYAPQGRQGQGVTALFDWRTVATNVQLPLEIMGVPRAERERRTADLVRLMNLQEFARSYPWQLSGGMQQRVSIARALSFRPSILLMDEPFGALDEMTRERLNMELLTIWAQTATTVLFVTHSIPEAVFLSDRIVVMSPRPGKIERIIDVDLPRPRTSMMREDARFFRLIGEVRACL